MNHLENARDYATKFHAHQECTSLSQGEIELRNLALLREAVELEIATHVYELVTFEGMSWSTVATSLASHPEVLKIRYRRDSGLTSE